MVPVYFNSDLPFLSFSFAQWDLAGREWLTVLVKGVFLVDGHGRLKACRDKGEITFQDQFSGGANVSSLLSESDLAPFKPKTDLMFNAVARAPEGKALPGWPVRFDIEGRLSYGFHVQGKRQFEPLAKAGGGREWRLSDSEPMTALPLRYEYAYGGTVPVSDEEVDSYACNPVGRGFTSDYLLRQDNPIAAPQIGALAELNAMKTGSSITVHGCGAVTKSWLPRLALAGTLDEAWLRERHPLMPTDFDSAYWNAAPLPLQLAPYLRGDETITMRGLFHDPRPYAFQLPGAGFGCRVRRGRPADSGDYALDLDTVHCDIASENPAEHRITLVWRIMLDEPDTITDVALRPRGLVSDKAAVAPAGIAERKRRENEEARKALVEERKRLAAVIEKSGMSAEDIAAAFAVPAVSTLVNEAEEPFDFYHHPQTGRPVVTRKGERTPVHIGDSRYVYQWGNAAAPAEVSAPVMPLKLDEERTIYVRLLGEAVDVWRPVKALWHGDDLFYILMMLQQERICAGEQWEFSSNQKVVCERRQTENGEVFVAVKKSGFS